MAPSECNVAGNQVLYRVHNGVADLTLNRPNYGNAFNHEVLACLHQLLKKAAGDKQVKAIKLSGSGKHFCAGADVHWMQQAGCLCDEENFRDAQMLSDFFQRMICISKPIVCCVHGAVRGGGLGLMACSDLVLAEPDSHFAFSEIKLGLIPAVIAPYVVNIIGSKAARRYFLTGEIFSVNDAQKLGLVDEIVPHDELEEKAASLLHELGGHPDGAMADIKSMMMQFKHQKTEEDLVYFCQLMALRRASKEAQSGMQAFLKKTSHE